MIEISFKQGTLLIKGNVRVPNSIWDERSGSFRAPALYYRDIVNYLKESGIDFEDAVLDLLPCPDLSAAYEASGKKLKLRDYQAEALVAWSENEKWGVLVLPTGSGKTLLGIRAIAGCNTPALVIVPTLDLLEQWKTQLEVAFSMEIGKLGGGEKKILPITVSTYDSAYIHAETLGNRFGLLVFDEVHHLPAAGYRSIAEFSAAPCRLGLTATYEREDGLHTELNRLVGGKVYEKKVSELAGGHLAPYTIKRFAVTLTEKEQREYDRNYSVFLDYLRKTGMLMRGARDFQKLVMKSGRDPEARKALLARNAARDLAFNSNSKIEKLREILEQHREDRVFIFTEHNRLVHRISNTFFIPAITYRTPAKERNSILEKFRTGSYRAVVTSKVLDEGIDVPEANIGIIVSGTGSKRAYVQRLGRILRKKEGKEAVLYEIIAGETTETGTARRRKEALSSGKRTSKAKGNTGTPKKKSLGGDSPAHL
ncbi:TPA: DEAD/DEAH box helicase [Methanosarcina acetivorans]|uniref:DNA 3'-5' helicase n=2 Tax=Methanosarcina acetivorans TaxID=2214 RepID=Q8TN90_METAC|nr:DEAD/DEAH box helicase family protein [Methanosarcina acetivorans]AAM05789.1 DNA repair protein [Methanosarcina acetivorans C2A]HIH95726.1 DEAD/DEAH box helicase [Methanosarcina acetivorans]